MLLKKLTLIVKYTVQFLFYEIWVNPFNSMERKAFFLKIIVTIIIYLMMIIRKKKIQRKPGLEIKN